MSIADQITRLQGVKADIITSIVNKGVDVPSGTMLGDLPRYIQDIGFNVIGGRAYRTVTIGGKTWMAENLDFKFSPAVGQSGTSSTEPRASYYNNDEATYGINGNRYGLLYNWIAVKHLQNNRAELIPGWHVPSRDEWDALATAAGGDSVAFTKLKSTTGWSSDNGTDDYGFSVFPSGVYDGQFDRVGTLASFWTSSEYYGTYAYYSYISARFAIGYFNKITQCSVRLVKD